ncbi:MAG: hypothetical protein ABSE62_04085 [Chthoniobacteraceae bacterium]|jgi:hypothetical protein
MTWDKPKKLSGWLWLLAPAGVCVLATTVGTLAQPHQGGWVAWALVGLLIATGISFVQSIWLARVNSTFGRKLGCMLLCFAILMVVNGTVSFAGCVACSSKLGLGID